MLFAVTLSACLVDGKDPLLVQPIPLAAPHAPDDEEAGALATAPPICQRMAVVNALEVDTPWNGDLETCNPGTPVDALGHRAQAQLDFARELAGHPRVDARIGGIAQECAVLMHANGALSHYPDASWSCYEPEAGDSAAVSLLASVPGVTAIRGYLVDPGNDTTLGHRRWLLSPWVDEVTFGSTDQYSCVHLSSYDTSNEDTWTAWPPPGEIPRGMLESYGFTVDDVGWSIQSDTMDLSTATVTISYGGIDRPMRVFPLDPWMGSASAIRFVPRGWEGLNGPFHVWVDGVDEPFDYVVEIVDCPE